MECTVSDDLFQPTAPSRLLRHTSNDYCPVEAALNRIGGKWKALVILRLLVRARRFNELQRTLPGITQRMLTRQLRELESDGIVRREIFAEVPPHVEYSLSPAGHALRAVIQHMCEWGQLHVQGEAADFEAVLEAVS